MNAKRIYLAGLVESCGVAKQVDAQRSFVLDTTIAHIRVCREILATASTQIMRFFVLVPKIFLARCGALGLCIHKSMFCGLSVSTEMLCRMLRMCRCRYTCA